MANRKPITPCKFTLDEIMEDIGKVFDMAPDKIRSKEKSASIVSVREIFIYVTAWLDNAEGGSTPISRYLGKHRTAITKQRKKIADYIEMKDQFFSHNLIKYQRESKIWFTLIQNSPKNHLSYADAIESVRSVSTVRDRVGRG